MFFDTVYLLDENGSDVFGYRNGEGTTIPSSQAFGLGLAIMKASIPTDGHAYAVETGIIKTPWGLEAVAIGPVVPNTAALAPPKRARLLIIAKAFDADATRRLGEDYVIPELRLADAGETGGIALSDRSGNVVGRMVWAAQRLGSRAKAEVGPMVYLMFGTLLVGVGALTILTVVSFRRSDDLADEALTQHRRLEVALASVPHGICMFDANQRLVFCNARYGQLYQLPSHLMEPGTRLQDIFDFRVTIGNAPVDVPDYLSPARGGVAGGSKVFEITLADGRMIRIRHLDMDGGSYLASHEDMTEAARAEKRLVQAARHDGLTDLPNRMAFREKSRWGGA